MPAGIAAIETGREAATIIMLIGVSALAGADGWERLRLNVQGVKPGGVFATGVGLAATALAPGMSRLDQAQDRPDASRTKAQRSACAPV
jgi:hypothetical protein